MAQELAREFSVAGYPAASLDGRVKKQARREINDRFRSGELRVLTNARLISEGYDVPDVDTVIIASNMTSPAMLLQAVGRGKRSSQGKREELVLDLAGVCISLGMHPDDDLKYSLEGVPIRTEKERGDKISRCAECLGVFWANEFVDSTCPRCGFVRPGRPDPRVVAAELEELKRGRAAKNPDVSLLREILDQAVSDKQARFLFNRRRGYWPSNALLERAKV
jgi:superfamily II DNA or RNA helicase